MKIIRLLPALLLSGVVSGAAAQGFSMGPRVGVNFSSFAVSAYNISTPIGDAAVDQMEADNEMQIGPQAGLMFNIGISRSFSFQPELMYSGKGYKQGGTYTGLLPDDPFTGTEREYSIKLNYIELPMLFKLAVGSETFKGHIMAGPYVSYLMGGENSYKLGGNELLKGDLNDDFTDDNQAYYFQKFDYGATLGAGVTFTTNAGSFVLDGRYSMGVPEVMSYNPSLSDTAVRNRNATFGVSLGWLYHFPYTPRPVNDYGGVFND